MKYPKVAVALVMIAIGCFVLAIFGESIRSVFLAIGFLALLSAYVLNQRVLNRLKVDPFTGQQSDTIGSKVSEEEL